MTIKFIKPVPFGIDITKNHIVDLSFGSLMVKNKLAVEVKVKTDVEKKSKK